MWSKIKTVTKVINWIIGVLCAFFFAFYFYTPEYNNGTKEWLDESFEISHIFFILLCGSIVFIISIITNKFANSIEKLNDEKESLKKESLEYKYKLSQIVDSSIKNRDKYSIDTVNEALRDFVEGNDYVISAQIYKCKKSIRNRKITYSICDCEYKYVRDGERVNDVREIYTFDKRKLDKYRKLKENYAFNHDKYKEECAEYIADLTKRINRKENGDVTDSVLFDYCCLCLSIQYMFGQNHTEIKSIKKEYQEKIRSERRDGFLKGIIEKDYFKFRNQRNANKDRFYITKCIEFEKYSVPYIFVIAIGQEVTQESDYTSYLDDIGEKFYDVLTNKLNLVYNNSEGKEGSKGA